MFLGYYLSYLKGIILNIKKVTSKSGFCFMVTRNCAKLLFQIARLAKHRKPACRKYEFAIFDFISLSKSAIRYYSILCSSTQRFYQNIGPKTFKNRRTTTNNHGQPQKVIKEYIIFLSIKMMVVVRGSSW